MTLSLVLELSNELSLDNQNEKTILLKDLLKSYCRNLLMPEFKYHKRISIILHDILIHNCFETEKQLLLFKEKVKVLEQNVCTDEDVIKVDRELFEEGLDWIMGNQEE